MSKSLIEKVMRVICHHVENEKGKIDWEKIRANGVNFDFDTWVTNACMNNGLEMKTITYLKNWRVIPIYEQCKKWELSK